MDATINQAINNKKLDAFGQIATCWALKASITNKLLNSVQKSVDKYNQKTIDLGWTHV